MRCLMMYTLLLFLFAFSIIELHVMRQFILFDFNQSLPLGRNRFAMSRKWKSNIPCKYRNTVIPFQPRSGNMVLVEYQMYKLDWKLLLENKSMLYECSIHSNIGWMSSVSIIAIILHLTVPLKLNSSNYSTRNFFWTLILLDFLILRWWRSLKFFPGS